jgi:hypothetical protein
MAVAIVAALGLDICAPSAPHRNLRLGVSVRIVGDHRFTVSRSPVLPLVRVIPTTPLLHDNVIAISLYLEDCNVN